MLMLQARCGLLLRHRREQGRQVINRVDVVPPHGFQDLLQLRAVHVLEVPLDRDRGLQRSHPDVGDDDMLGAVALLQGGDQLGADLTKCAGDQDVSHFSPEPIGSP